MRISLALVAISGGLGPYCGALRQEVGSRIAEHEGVLVNSGWFLPRGRFVFSGLWQKGSGLLKL